MYKLLIVDDDEIICQGLATCIPWQEHRIEVIDTASDGEMALEIVDRNQPDIVLADINMPFMDGIELSYQLRQKYPGIKIILITAYREFEYAKKAVQLQVFDFVTKPFTNEEILKSVLEAQERIFQEETIQKEVNKNMSLIREKYLSEATIFGRMEEGKKKIYGLSSEHSEFMIAVMSLSFLLGEKEQESTLVEEEIALQIAMEKIQKEASQQTNIHTFRQNHYIVIIFENWGTDAESQIHSVLKRWMSMIAKEDVFFLACGVGKSYQRVENLPLSLAQARNAVEFQYYFGHCSVIFYDEIAEISTSEGNQVIFNSYLQQALEGIQNRDIQLIKDAIEDFYEIIKNPSAMGEANAALLSMELLVMCYRETGSEKLYKEFIRKSTVFYPVLLNTENVVQLQKIIDKNFQDLFEYIEDDNVSSLGKIVKNAVYYMEEHFADSDLTLNQVAESVHISANYLCTLFKQYKKVNYINYLTQIRLENAKNILKDKERKTYEVAFLVGYNSSQYFSSSFKKYTGMTPGEYRDHYVKGR